MWNGISGTGGAALRAPTPHLFPLFARLVAIDRNLYTRILCCILMVLDPVTELDAGAFDQVAYRGYIPQMLAFPAIAVQVDALRNGLAAVIERAPFIGGEVYEDDEGWVKLRWRDDCSVDELLLVAEHPDLGLPSMATAQVPRKRNYSTLRRGVVAPWSFSPSRCRSGERKS